jgi:hypothetical protein
VERCVESYGYLSPQQTTVLPRIGSRADKLFIPSSDQGNQDIQSLWGLAAGCGAFGPKLESPTATISHLHWGCFVQLASARIVVDNTRLVPTTPLFSNLAKYIPSVSAFRPHATQASVWRRAQAEGIWDAPVLSSRKWNFFLQGCEGRVYTIYTCTSIVLMLVYKFTNI